MSEIEDRLRAFAENLHTPETVNEKLAVALLDVGMMKLAARALQGEFSDFDSPLALPKMALVNEIMAAPYGAEQPRKADRLPLVQRVKAGEFDG